MKKILMILALFAALASPVSATTFPVDDASIAAYVQLSSVDLAAIADDFYEVYDLNSNYILGTIYVQGLSSHYYIKTYVGADGWVVAYVPRDVPMAQMIKWRSKPENNPPLFPTTLESAIEAVCTATGIDYSTVASGIKYYDFEHPDATDMTIIIDGTGDFSLLIPNEITIHDASASMGSVRGSRTNKGYHVDNEALMGKSVGIWNEYTEIPLNLLTKGETHRIYTESNTQHGNYPANSATILVYSKP